MSITGINNAFASLSVQDYRARKVALVTGKLLRKQTWKEVPD